MSLFAINRYLGESSPQVDKSSAQQILSKLHAKAKAREEGRRLSAGNHVTEHTPDKDERKSVKPKQTSSDPDFETKKSITVKLKRQKKRERSEIVGDKDRIVDSRKVFQLKKMKRKQNDNSTEDAISNNSSKDKRTSEGDVEMERPTGNLESELNIELQGAGGSGRKKKTKNLIVQVEESKGVKGVVTEISTTSPKKMKISEKQTDSGGKERSKVNSNNARLQHEQKDVGKNKKRIGDAGVEDAHELTGDVGMGMDAVVGKDAKKFKLKIKQKLKVMSNQRADNDEGRTKQDGIGDDKDDSSDEGDEKMRTIEDTNDDDEEEEEDEDSDNQDVEMEDEDARSDANKDQEGTSFAVLGEFERNKKKKVKEMLPNWLAKPSVIEHNLAENSVNVEAVKGIDTRLLATLKSMGIEKFFPVQHHVIPVVMETLRFGIRAGCAGYRPRDLCVSAPTGSGKTLAYSVPIVQALLDRVVPRVRALVVLPTRDLATQVHKVVGALCKSTPLRVVLVGGTKRFAREQSLLVKESDGQFHSLADIVIATPGRLVDNINQTPGFTLQHLRFLVIDEADRMMDQLSQDWITQVEKSAYPVDTPASHNELVPSSNRSLRPRPGPLTAARSSTFHQPLQKLLFSATLSQNPEKLIQLQLFRPHLITAVTAAHQHPSGGQRSKPPNLKGDDGINDDVNDQDGEDEPNSEFVGKYTTPVGLSEYYIPCSAGDKPLVLLHLLQQLYIRQVLCFTNTLQATHRLYLLLKLAGGVEVAEFSSNLGQAQRQSILKQFKAGKIQILVCSDAMARGMDIDNVKCVISYDLPPHLKTYIHRVGRTARAGRAGTAFSFIRKLETTQFKHMLRNAGKEGLQRHSVKASHLEPLVPAYTKALAQLPALIKEEKYHQY